MITPEELEAQLEDESPEGEAAWNAHALEHYMRETWRLQAEVDAYRFRKIEVLAALMMPLRRRT